MTALAQGSAGVALVMCFALLRARQGALAVLILLTQSVAVTGAAVALGRPAMGMPPLILAGMVWLVRRRSDAAGLLALPVGGTKLGVVVGAVLAALCQSQGAMAEPLAIVLLGILLAATRPHALMQVIALIAMQNGLALAGCHLPASAALVLACFLLAMPPAIVLIAAQHRSGWHLRLRPHAGRIGWARCAVCFALFAATLTVPLDPLGAVFATLFGLEGVLRSWSDKNRLAQAPFGHAAAVLRLVCTIVAVATPNPLLAAIAILAALGATILPAREQRWPHGVLAFSAAAVALLGLLIVSASPIGWVCLIVGYAAVAATVPDLAAPLVVLVLRLATAPDSVPTADRMAATSWMPSAGWAPSIVWLPASDWLCVAVGLFGLLACAVALWVQASRHRSTLLYLAQASMALIAVGGSGPDGRYACVILLILLVLTRAASRFATTATRAIAVAGLGGIPPFGVFPALVLLVLSFCDHRTWLLLPFGAAIVSILPAALPSRLPSLFNRSALLSAAWLPLVLAFGFGFLAPDALARWLRLLVAVPS